MRLLWCLLGLLAVGCTAPRMATSGKVEVAQASDLPAPTREDQVAIARPNLVGPFDTLTVEVVGIENMTRDVVVDAEGRISLPIAGLIDVGRKTPSEITDIITQRLRAGYVRNPQVVVNLKEVESQSVTIDGGVRKPGLYKITGDMTMMRVVARAEGLSDSARDRHVVIFRKVGGHDMAAVYDLQSIRLGYYSDPAIYPNDVVVVGTSSARQLFPQLLQAGVGLLSPLVLLLR
jgi:polysaccharide biosynthesis/export protein